MMRYSNPLLIRHRKRRHDADYAAGIYASFDTLAIITEQLKPASTAVTDAIHVGMQQLLLVVA
jgi:hypothetical protein